VGVGVGVGVSEGENEGKRDDFSEAKIVSNLLSL